jgi:hypothetical protein
MSSSSLIFFFFEIKYFTKTKINIGQFNEDLNFSMNIKTCKNHNTAPEKINFNKGKSTSTKLI